MTQDQLKAIAEQHYAGKAIEEIDFGTTLSAARKFDVLVQALTEFPKLLQTSSESDFHFPKKRPRSKGLTKPLQKEKDALERKLLDLELAVQSAYSQFFADEDAEWEPVEILAEAYRSVIEEANAFILAVQEWMQSHVNGRAEGWEDSDKGEAYLEWQEIWNVELSTWELPDGEEEEDLEFEAFQQFMELPNAPNEI